MSLPKPYYEDDHCRIFHGDCLELIPLLEFDVVVTDPPYGIAWESVGVFKPTKTKSGRVYSPSDPIAGDGDLASRDAALDLFGEKPQAVFGSFRAEFPADTRRVLVWRKPNDSGFMGQVGGFRADLEPVFLLGQIPTPVETGKSSLLTSNVGSIARYAESAGHPHAKPIDLLRELFSVVGDGTILDPFMGSGSTLRAAKDLGRKSIGIDVSLAYCEIAARRMGQEVLF